jgi:hypothetical protein
VTTPDQFDQTPAVGNSRDSEATSAALRSAELRLEGATHVLANEVPEFITSTRTDPR